MIKFLNEDVRLKFHELPIDRQRELQSFGEKNDITILFVMIEENGISEVSIRIDEKLNDPGVLV